jgi:hypothetical protein
MSEIIDRPSPVVIDSAVTGARIARRDTFVQLKIEQQCR